MPAIIIIALFFAVNSVASEPLAPQSFVNKELRVAVSSGPDIPNTAEELAAIEQRRISFQNAYFGKSIDRPVSAHKVNYFSVNHLPGTNNSQVKFQISMRFRLLEPNLYVLKYNLFPAYIAYTQKSLWNAGRHSMPFEESNFNPEFFLDYPVNARLAGRLKLRNVIICPLEHESNGLDDTKSRSWNRQYISFSLGYESKKKMGIPNSFISDKVSVYVKFWRASGYSAQNDYLKSIGDSAKFLDYMGQGETGISIRNFVWGGGLKNHQLDIKTPIYLKKRKRSCEFEFRQQLPHMNFAIFLQYWYGYGETLLRFNKFGHRSFAGLSFSY
jgi:phospholipase A1